jgi:hypothetical protein
MLPIPALAFRVTLMTFHLAVSVHANLPAWLAVLHYVPLA